MFIAHGNVTGLLWQGCEGECLIIPIIAETSTEVLERISVAVENNTATGYGDFQKLTKFEGVTEPLTWVVWRKLERKPEPLTDDLNPQLTPFLGRRVEVVRENGEKSRFIVGRSTGWKPCHLEVKTKRSLGGTPADKQYLSVKAV
jgi:hypothetical protein